MSGLKYLIPDANYTDLPIFPIKKYGEFMSEVFTAWNKRLYQNQKIFIRFCINILELFMGKISRVEGYGKRDNSVLPLICIANNGDLGPLDELRNAVPELFTK